MLNDDYKKLMEELKGLPTGGITYKKINGKEYAYYQWREDGKQRARRAKDDELPILLIEIERRKEIENQLRGMRTYVDMSLFWEYPYNCQVRTGEELEQLVAPVAEWEKRECYKDLHEYVYGDYRGRVFILYGLRRTGKTTLMHQLIAEMDKETRRKCAYIQASRKITLDDVYRDLRYLEKEGYRYIFIDEVTLLEDFIEDAAVLSDIFASSGMKIILSGTDSLGFLFAEDEQLFDRCIICHTTFIPYREFERVLGVKGIDDYIRYGGTMCMSGKHYNITQVFSSKKSVDEYINSAIAHNIQHSLKYYQYEDHFRSLRDLYEANELTSAINRVVEDINHRFTLEVLTRDFKSSDLSISAKNLRKDRENPTESLDIIDKEQVSERLKQLLEIRNKNEQSIEIDEDHRFEIKEYLDLLDLTIDVRHVWMQKLNRKDIRTIFTQPGMRYAQAEFLINSLVEDEVFQELPMNEQSKTIERILNEIKGRMMEDIVLLETMMARTNCEVFCLKFNIGEFDMVVFDREKICCEIYEIKHSSEIAPEQTRHLHDEKKCSDTAFRYGKITGKYVIYRGEECEVDGVQYLNVEKYLKGL